MVTMVRIDLPIKTGRGLNDRLHWAARHRIATEEREVAAMLVRAAVNREGVRLWARQLPKRPFYAPAQDDLASTQWMLPATVTVTRLSAGELDGDNLQGALKGVRDGIADAFGVADNDPRITWRYAQGRCKRGDGGVVVEIEEGT